MRSFQRRSTLDPVPGALVRVLASIDRSAGSEARFADQLPQLLTSLSETARIESITASSAIEGVIVETGRAPGLATGAISRFRTRSEAEFAGYRAALDYIYSAQRDQLSVGLILHVHRLLFSYTDGGGGRLKLYDNVVVERDATGGRHVRFAPTSAAETPYYLSELIDRTISELSDGEHHPLLVISAFALDLSCIHPFADGNGRVTRLMTAFLLEQCGYGVGRYISVEQLILETKDDYYAALAGSTAGWFDDGRHELWPWAQYLCTRLAGAYELFGRRIAAASTEGAGKQDRVRQFVLLHGPDRFTIGDIRRAVPGVSDPTIRLVLASLRDEGRIDNDGTGRAASWGRR